VLEQVGGLGGQPPKSALAVGLAHGAHDTDVSPSRAGRSAAARTIVGSPPQAARLLYRGGEPVNQQRSNDRRRGRRLPMNSAVSQLDPRATTPVSDLSETGVFVHTEDPLPLGAEIELKFTVQLDEPVLFLGRGRVVRHRSDDPCGMGVEFIELDDTARDVLQKLMLRAEADRARPTLAHTDPTLRTHGLVARLVSSEE
jgi:hypothetical protein